MMVWGDGGLEVDVVRDDEFMSSYFLGMRVR